MLDVDVARQCGVDPGLSLQQAAALGLPVEERLLALTNGGSGSALDSTGSGAHRAAQDNGSGDASSTNDGGGGTGGGGPKPGEDIPREQRVQRLGQLVELDSK